MPRIVRRDSTKTAREFLGSRADLCIYKANFISPSHHGEDWGGVLFSASEDSQHVDEHVDEVEIECERTDKGELLCSFIGEIN